jgi:carboxyl-terminal processing protease
MRQLLRWFLLLMLLVLCLVTGVLGGIGVDRRFLTDSGTPTAPATQSQADLRLISQAWSIITANYVDRTALQDPNRLIYGAISGMVDSLGDTGHSRFLSPDMLKSENRSIQGEFEGIGAEVQLKDGHVVIVAPIDGSPAQKAGLRPGDIILKVDGQDVTGLPLNQVVDKILGPAGTPVTLTIASQGQTQPRDVKLIRARIEIHNVTWVKIPGTNVAHVRLTAFSQGVTDDLRNVLTQIQSQGISAAILDLRNNPGGLLDEAVGTASQFMPSGNVLLEKDAKGNTKPVPVESGGRGTSLTLVVLVNAGTASASEIVAGALQDAKRAQVVGETTFGTGTVLDQFKLSDGSALLLATQEWLTPNGRVIWHQGIVPDVTVTLDANADPLLPDAEKLMTPQQFQASGDKQLLEGLRLLTPAGG